ncbi:MAG: cytochrome P460 family protein [Gammaproteobacteria bacterium]|nr:cytochrome P460 family protein [Gammaproteobacteria bacterium]
MKHFLHLTLLASTLTISCLSQADDRVDYPEDYRSWTHIKSMVLHPGHPLENPFKGIHHVYGNDKAVDGTQTGKFEDGSVLVFDLLGYQTQDNASTEGDRVLVGVMVKNSKRYAKTGGWAFEGFKGNSHTDRLVEDGGQSCFACHTSQQDHDYVFSHWRE